MKFQTRRRPVECYTEGMRKSSSTHAARPAARSGRHAGAFRIGYVPLVDAAPLVVAQSLDLFTKAGLNVHLSRELGWGSIREKIVYGELDAAHAPGGLLYSILLGTHSRACAVSTDLVLNLQGNAITLSRRLWQKGVRDGETFRRTVRSERPRKPTLAVVSPFSSHHFLLREWLRSIQLNPADDVRIVILPPPLVADHMREGLIDGFCAGEPWNSAASLVGDGWVIATSGMIAPLHPEKVLLTRNEVIHRHPDVYEQVRGVILEACRFCDLTENRPAVADILRDAGVFALSKEIVSNALVAPFHTGIGELKESRPFVSFYRDSANRATRERADWCLDAVLESGFLSVDGRSRKFCLDAFCEPAAPAKSRRPKASAA